MNDLEDPFDQIEPRSNRHYPTLLLSRGNLRIFGEGPCGALDRDAIMLTSPQARTLLRGGGFELLRTDFRFIVPRALWYSGTRSLPQVYLTVC
jgi:hypothetical protein